MADPLAVILTATYTRVRPGTVAATVDVDPAVLLDVDEYGRVLGVETIGRPFDYTTMLAILSWLTLPAKEATRG